MKVVIFWGTIRIPLEDALEHVWALALDPNGIPRQEVGYRNRRQHWTTWRTRRVGCWRELEETSPAYSGACQRYSIGRRRKAAHGPLLEGRRIMNRRYLIS